MKKEKKRIISFFIVVILIAASVSIVVPPSVDFIQQKDIENNILSVKIFVDKREGVVPLDVKFSSLVFYHKGEVDYKWEFGDGKTSTEPNPAYIYKENGTYTCNLAVIDSDGQKNTDSIVILVEPIKMQIPGIDINPRNSERPYKGYPRLMLLSIILRNKLYKEWDLRGRLIVNMIENPEFETLKEFFFSNVDGWVTCKAQVTNPEDVDTFIWTLNAPPVIAAPPSRNIEYHNVSFSTKNNTITFPAINTYREDEYTVILEILDSSGKVIGINSEEFYITASKEKLRVEGYKKLIFTTILGTFITYWKQTWSKDEEGFVYGFVNRTLNKILDLNSPLVSALLLRFLEILISANALEVWDEIPYEWAEFYKLLIEKAILDKDKVAERLMQHLKDMDGDKIIKKVILTAFCWLFHIDFEIILEELGYLN
jgi:PKD repeat protein